MKEPSLKHSRCTQSQAAMSCEISGQSQGWERVRGKSVPEVQRV